MKQTLFCAAILMAACSLAACKRATETAPATATAGSNSSSSSSSNSAPAPHPMQGVRPHEPETAAAKPSTGPAEGGTAVGGMVGHRDQGGNSSTTSQATGGDGAKK